MSKEIPKGEFRKASFSQERYGLHHGVSIQDAALVAAATLSVAPAESMGRPSHEPCACGVHRAPDDFPSTFGGPRVWVFVPNNSGL